MAIARGVPLHPAPQCGVEARPREWRRGSDDVHASAVLARAAPLVRIIRVAPPQRHLHRRRRFWLLHVRDDGRWA